MKCWQVVASPMLFIVLFLAVRVNKWRSLVPLHTCDSKSSVGADTRSCPVPKHPPRRRTLSSLLPLQFFDVLSFLHLRAPPPPLKGHRPHEDPLNGRLSRMNGPDSEVANHVTGGFARINISLIRHFNNDFEKNDFSPFDDGGSSHLLKRRVNFYAKHPMRKKSSNRSYFPL